MRLKTDTTRITIIAALFAALTCIGTMIIKIPTPTNGYIHPGDGFVLLSGLLLGPVWGALAAGFGSALSDLIGGYFIYVPHLLLRHLQPLQPISFASLLQNIYIQKQPYQH